MEVPAALPREFAPPDLAAADAVLAAARAQKRVLLDEHESKRLLAAFGLPVPRTVAAQSRDAAVAAARDIGFPAVLKILSPDLSHKSDVGGVRLDLRDADMVAAAWDDMMRHVKSLRPGARIEGATPRLRDDPRVCVRERQNARHVGAGDFDTPIDLVVVDASFISLDKLLGAIAAILPTGGELCALVKPQFEAGRRAVTRGRGVIRDEQVRREAIDKAIADIQRAGFTIIAETPSPLPGPKGNLEHFVHARRS